MSRAVKTKQLSTNLSTKENAADSIGIKRSTRARRATPTEQNTKGNDKLIKTNVISTLRSPVLQDRTNLTLEPTKVVLKKGKDEKAGTDVTRSNETKFTRSKKSKDDEQFKEIGSNIEENKASLAKNETSQEKNRKMQSSKKMQGLTSSNSKEETDVKAKENIRSTRTAEKAYNRASNNVRSLEKNKNLEKITELPEEVEVKTRNIQAKNIDKTEPSSKKTGLKQTKLSVLRLRKTSTQSSVERKPSEEVAEQKRSVTRSKKNVENKLDIPLSTPVEDTEVSTKRLITRSKNIINTADDRNEPKSSQNLKRTVKSKIPTKQSTKDVPTTSAKRRSSIRIKNTVGEKKFFSNRSKPVGHSKISPLKRAVLGIGQRNTKNKKARVIPVSRQRSSFHLRQTTLSESFSNHSKKVLRPRNANKNYCEDSKTVDKHSSADERNGIEEPGVSSEKKGPIYKKVQLEESQEKDKEKVYDFIPDKNDVKKKRKKTTIRKAPVKKAKTVVPKTVNTKSHIDAVPVKTLNKLIAEQAKAASNKKPDNEQKIVQKPVVAPKISTKPPNEKNAAVDYPHTIEITEEIYAPPSPDIGHEATDMQETLKLSEQNRPKIIGDHELRGEHRINITGTPLQPKLKEETFSRPFRETNAFNKKPSNQMKTMMDHSLIRRSLSPISKAKVTAFVEDTGSPWRPFIPNTFSRVKNVFQSTPQGDKFMSITAKTALGSNKQRLCPNMAKIEEQKNENGNISKNKVSPVKCSNILKTPIKISNKIAKSPIKKLNNSKSPRKFGTEIFNMNSSDENRYQKSPSKSPRKFGSEISNVIQVNTPRSSPTKAKSPKRSVEFENSPSIIEIPQIITPTPLVSEIIPELDEIVEDKENSAPNNQSPLRTSTEIIQVQTPLHPTEELIIPRNTIQAAEEFEPQPGPSGLQKSKSPDDAWKLKHTNLNKFLNLPDMPESTRIVAAGIFDDAHSTPINGKKVKKLAAQLDVVDAFGFDEPDDSSTELEKISPITRDAAIPLQVISNKQLLTNAKINLLQINKESNPVRISIGEIKKTLQKNKEKNEVDGAIPVVNQKSDHVIKKNVVQAISFTDTFDMENEEINTQDVEKTIKEIPLFVDLEPVHFTQPPRYSYKRKRHHQSYEETEDEVESEEDVKHQTRPQKKKRIGKVEREQKKKIDKWAKDMNETFEEIDHFDLVVE